MLYSQFVLMENTELVMVSEGPEKKKVLLNSKQSNIWLDLSGYKLHRIEDKTTPECKSFHTEVIKKMFYVCGSSVEYNLSYS